MDEADLCRRADILEGFAIFMSRDPDLMVADAFAAKEGRIRFRQWSACANGISVFQRSLDDPEATRVQAGNVVRSFFIHNGVFIGAPLASWLRQRGFSDWYEPEGGRERP